MDKISDLPKDILQRILYFLSQKEAVQTSVLSKSWRYIWCTRPNLDFADINFKGKRRDFVSIVDTTLQLYCDRRLCLEEFYLYIKLQGDHVDQELVSLLEKWIQLLASMGVKDFRLSILAGHNVRGIIDLPIVLQAKSLKLLCLYNCNLGQKIPENIPFVHLQELRLCNVLIKNEIFHRIISSCPLLITMRFEECTGLKTIKLEKKFHKYLKHFVFINRNTHVYDECSIEIDAPTLETLETIKIIGSKVLLQGHKFSNLKLLTLQTVEISRNSIEQSQLCIDAPNIMSFHYSGFIIPSISSTPSSRMSTIALYIRDVDDAQSWFLRLSKLLQALHRSKIFLNIVQLSRNNLHIEDDILVQDIINGGNGRVVVEHFEFDIGHLSSFPSVLNGLFCICRPRNITPRWFSQGPNWNKERELKEFGEFFCMIQMMRESGNPEIWHDLEDLTIEGFDESRREWRPLQVTRLSESALRDFRVRLRWTNQDCESSSNFLAFRIIDT